MNDIELTPMQRGMIGAMRKALVVCVISFLILAILDFDTIRYFFHPADRVRDIPTCETAGYWKPNVMAIDEGYVYLTFQGDVYRISVDELWEFKPCKDEK